MILTDHFAFIHMHKTGGQSLNDIITQSIAGSRTVGYHFPRSELPAEARHLPVVGMIRNPWDWYVSWYAFNKRPKILNPLFTVASDNGTASFKATVTNLVTLGAAGAGHERRRKALAALLPESLDGNRGVGLTRGSIDDLAASGTGYYSWLFGRMFGDDADGNTHIGRFENLQHDFVSIMETLNVKEAASIRDALQNRERRNFSVHSHYSHYYDDELRDLVAANEQGLIDRYGYEFESLKPDGVSYDFPADLYRDGEAEFRKLLGREANFLRINNHFDGSAILDKMRLVDDRRWRESDRDRLFAVHRQTEALTLVHFEDHKYEVPEYRDLYSEFENELQPLVDYVAAYYKNNGFIVRLILAKLLAGGSIPRHTDAGYSLLNCHRIHLPLITNDEVRFFVGDEEINMRAGELWEINNGTVHGVENRSSEDRVHLIIDWMPNHAGKPLANVLRGDDLGPEERAAANAEMIDALLARAHQLHRSGDVRKAESLYRQIMHFDDTHAVACNLLGLLLLQTQRSEEAATVIARALELNADDPQAHANLGLALKNLNRLDEAASHMQTSLDLAPGSPRNACNLGSIYMALGRPGDAIACFQQALSLQPGMVEAHFNLGSALFEERRYDEAVASLRQCLSLKPDLAAGKMKLEQALRAQATAKA